VAKETVQNVGGWPLVRTGDRVEHRESRMIRVAMTDRPCSPPRFWTVSLRISCHEKAPYLQLADLCFVANCAVVSSPRGASRATFALKSAEYRFRLPVMQVHPSQEQTELKLLSELQGPAHLHPGHPCGQRSPSSRGADVARHRGRA
jgi:hypothetical protein